MIRRIALAQLRPGMFVSGVPGSWLGHGLWRTQFCVSADADIERLRSAGVAEVMIDTDRGPDVEPPRATEGGSPLAAGVAPAARGQERVAFASELDRAARIYRTARPAVIDMFREARMGHAINVEGAANLVEEISASVARNASALVSVARLKRADEYTFMHSVAVCALMIALARQLGLPDEMVRSAGLAGLLHDLGKAKTPPEILNKPGRLDEAEFAVMRRHPQAGHDLLVASGQIDAIALDVCMHHHEKMDGSGYPRGLSGESISQTARMGAVCDVYDAITSNRPYKAGWDPTESIKRMFDGCGDHFDPMIFKAFVRAVGIYPIGSLVRLDSGRLAVVVEQGSNLTTPVVKVFFSTKSQLHIAPQVVDLSRSQDHIVAHENPAAWGFSHLDELWAGETLRGR